MDEHFADLLSPLFPADAEINPPDEAGGLVLRVDWPMPKEGRHHRRSLPIDVHFTRELMTDYPNLGERSQAATDERIVAFVRQRVAEFDPNHNTLQASPPEPVRWTITPQQVMQ
jgi:Protein of unknown function (DUF3022)